MFTMKFKTQNEAFDSGVEVSRILRAVAEKIDQDYSEGTVMDLNGNAVGQWELR
jgi:hypothetical protein